jgi:hypothetical protein
MKKKGKWNGNIISLSLLFLNEESILRMGIICFEVTIAMTTKIIILWEATPSIPTEVHGHIGGTYLLHFKGLRLSQARNDKDAGDMLFPLNFYRTTSNSYPRINNSSKCVLLYAYIYIQAFDKDMAVCRIPDSCNLDIHRCKNLKSFKMPRFS